MVSFLLNSVGSELNSIPSKERAVSARERKEIGTPGREGHLATVSITFTHKRERERVIELIAQHIDIQLAHIINIFLSSCSSYSDDHVNARKEEGDSEEEEEGLDKGGDWDADTEEGNMDANVRVLILPIVSSILSFRFVSSLSLSLSLDEKDEESLSLEEQNLYLARQLEALKLQLGQTSQPIEKDRDTRLQSSMANM